MTAAPIVGPLIGLPFVRGARGPRAFDCWGLVLEVRARLGLALPPDYATGALEAAARAALFHAPRPLGWARVNEAEAPLGAIVLAPRTLHAGVIVDALIVHAHERAGVIAWRRAAWRDAFGALECWERAP